MRKISYRQEIKADEFESLVESVIDELRRYSKMTEDEALSTIIDVLAFKYWQENESLELNNSLDSFDSEYVRLYWNRFCNSKIGESVGCVGLDHRDEAVVAACMGIFSEYVTRRNFDATNVGVIYWLLERHKYVVRDEKIGAKAAALIKVYRRDKNTDGSYM